MIFWHLWLKLEYGRERSQPRPKLKVSSQNLHGVTEGKRPLVRKVGRWYRTQDLPNAKPTLYHIYLLPLGLTVLSGL